ncbi:MAG: cytidylate kinase-like family protein [Eubacterium sp.]|nr:cytidylate kinase-like family protein [Eubacterium sp.]
MKKKIIITIAREHGSGGLKVGKRLAEELGINCYDSEMFQLVSDSKNLRDNHVAHDDRIKGTSLFNVAQDQYKSHEGEEFPVESDDFLSMRDLFEYQSEIIRALADKESCVIVGRCSNYILKDRDDVVSVFIHAPIEYRARRISYVHDMPEKELIAYINSKDRHRADYYKYYTGHDWKNARYYDISLSTEKYGISGCAEEIKKFINCRYGDVI